MAKKKLPEAPQDWRILFAQTLAERQITPLEIMMTAMREYWHEAERYRQAAEAAMMMGDEEAAVEYHDLKFSEIEKAVAVAVKVAPYMHPRLLSTNNSIDTGPLKIELVRFSEKAKKAVRVIEEAPGADGKTSE